jgi:hypothetical protein
VQGFYNGTWSTKKVVAQKYGEICLDEVVSQAYSLLIDASGSYELTFEPLSFTANVDNATLDVTREVQPPLERHCFKPRSFSFFGHPLVVVFMYIFFLRRCRFVGVACRF